MFVCHMDLENEKQVQRNDAFYKVIGVRYTCNFMKFQIGLLYPIPCQTNKLAPRIHNKFQ